MISSDLKAAMNSEIVVRQPVQMRAKEGSMGREVYASVSDESMSPDELVNGLDENVGNDLSGFGAHLQKTGMYREVMADSATTPLRYRQTRSEPGLDADRDLSEEDLGMDLDDKGVFGIEQTGSKDENEFGDRISEENLTKEDDTEFLGEEKEDEIDERLKQYKKMGKISQAQLMNLIELANEFDRRGNVKVAAKIDNFVNSVMK